MMLGLGQEGSTVIPNCFAGEQIAVFDDGSYGCQTTLTAQSFGDSAPACSGGPAFIDPTTEDWACPPPPVPQQQSSAGSVIFAVVIAAAAFWYVGSNYGKKVSHVASGDFSDFLPTGASS